MILQACLQARYHLYMGQVTWRASDALIARVQRLAQANGTSMNEFLNRVLALATESDENDPAALRLRNRLRAAGVLAVSDAPVPQRADTASLARARAAAGRGASLAEIVSKSRT